MERNKRRMGLVEEDISKIVNFVKKEPRTVQEISHLIGRSWVTADSYVKQIAEKTGLIDIKALRQGTKGAVKIVYYNHIDSHITDDVKKHLFSQIMNGRRKTDFDFMEVYQFVKEEKKKCFVEEYKDENLSESQDIINLFKSAQKSIFCFSGNLSFVNMKEGEVEMMDILNELLSRGVRIKAITRVNIASVGNLNKIKMLMQKYPGMIEIKHSYQPLRGFLIDDTIARFKDEEQLKLYRGEELKSNTRIFYEIYDLEWISWLEKCFWSIFRSSIDYSTRLREIQKIF